MKIDHVGYAVKKMNKAIKEFEILGFRFEKIINDYDRNLYVCFGNMSRHTQRTEWILLIKLFL